MIRGDDKGGGGLGAKGTEGPGEDRKGNGRQEGRHEEPTGHVYMGKKHRSCWAVFSKVAGRPSTLSS